MGGEQKYFFAKFKMDPDLPTLKSLIVSEDRSEIDGWDGAKAKDSAAIEEPNQIPERSFRAAARAFEASIQRYEVAAPFIMQAAPLLMRFSEDRSIRRFAQKHGELLETGEFETYKLSMSFGSQLMDKLAASAAIHEGISGLPSMFILGLVSSYDVYLSNLIRTIFFSKPELLSSSEKNISFSDLLEVGSIEAARERLIEKEVESVMRESHVKQIEWLENKLGIPLKKDLKIWPEFVETFERRNLLTHTGGAISSQYLKVCKDHGFDTKNSKAGQVLPVTLNYYDNAVSVIAEFGNKLTQVVWRKLLPSEIELADVELDGLGYRLIKQRKYKAAANMFHFGLYEMKKHGSDATRKRMIVNYANAEKLAGNASEADRILRGEDWSATTDKYQICVAAVRDDVDMVIRMMGPTVDAKVLQISDFREWPVFEGIRSDPRFIEAFETQFGQALLLNRVAASAAESSRQDDDNTPDPRESGDQEAHSSEVIVPQSEAIH